MLVQNSFQKFLRSAKLHQPNEKIVTFKTAPFIPVPRIVTSECNPIIPAMTIGVKRYRSCPTSVLNARCSNISYFERKSQLLISTIKIRNQHSNNTPSNFVNQMLNVLQPLIPLYFFLNFF